LVVTFRRSALPTPVPRLPFRSRHESIHPRCGCRLAPVVLFSGVISRSDVREPDLRPRSRGPQSSARTSFTLSTIACAAVSNVSEAYNDRCDVRQATLVPTESPVVAVPCSSNSVDAQM
jgi:hypothetical protein